jgi:ATP synthase protein I
MSGNGLNERDNGGDVPTEGDLSDRLSRLDSALKRVRPAVEPAKGKIADAGAAAQGMAQALRLASEFAAGIIVGAGLGWFLDYFAGTSPWGMIVFLMLGFAAGVLNILRSASLTRGPGSTGG